MVVLHFTLVCKDVNESPIEIQSIETVLSNANVYRRREAFTGTHSMGRFSRTQQIADECRDSKIIKDDKPWMQENYKKIKFCMFNICVMETIKRG